ncbi:MAG TPA: hypothetical protein ENN09_02355 [Planctomycetes bacterium]|nr:hypothetical protein [Planctomycetota bacterium]
MKHLAVFAAVLLATGAFADFKVADTIDVVTLDDGSTVKGTIIAEGSRGVIVVGKTGEVVVPKQKVVKIERGKPESETKGYTTDPVEGVKVVTGEGFRDGQKSGGQSPQPQSGPAQASGHQKPGGQAGGGARVTPEMVKQAMQKNPQAAAWVNMVGGPDKAAALLNDPNKRKELEKTAQSLGIKLPF